MTMIYQKPTPAPAPVPSVTAPRTGVVNGVSTADPSAVYTALKAQRKELTNQLDELQSTRANISSQLEDLGPNNAGRTALEQRLNEVDSHVQAVDGMLAANATQIANAAAVPGAVVEQPPFVPPGPPDEAYVLGAIFMLVAILPISIAFARRIWRRSAAAVTGFPRELADRLTRLEQGIEATSLEVERIGEGQRFLTRLFTEGEGARAIGAAPSKPVKSSERLP